MVVSITSRLSSKHMKNKSYFDKYLLVSTRTVALIALYYCFSIGITFFQKWFIKGFHYPLTVVACHMMVKFMLASLIRFIYKCITGVSRLTLSWPIYVRKLAATGISSALDIGFSNWSFEFITISLYTMTKSTCVVFILGFAIFFDLEKKRFSLFIVVFLISSGLFMFTFQSTQFHLNGFLLVLSASVLGGLRWTLSQMVMQKKEIGLSNPVDMMYHVQPWMLLGLLPLALVFEAIPLLQTKQTITSDLFSNDSEYLWHTIKFILLGSILAFLMELSEFLLLSYTSSLTLSIAGIVKEVFTLYLAVEFNGDQMSTLNFLGLVLCMIGIALHVILKACDNSALLSNDNISDCEPKTQEFESKRLLEECEEEDVIFDLNPVNINLAKRE